MKITNPELKVIRFANKDVIATSLYFAPAAAFNATQGTSFTSDYVEFEGSMVGDGPTSWMISNIYGAREMDATEAASFAPGVLQGDSYYFEESGVTVPAYIINMIASQAYNAYEYDGNLYTNGASYYDVGGM